MIKVSSKIRSNWILILALFFSIFLLFLPGMSCGIDGVLGLSNLNGTNFDLNFHLLRVESIKEGLLAGEFPVKIHSLQLDGYGYANGVFYPQTFLYIPAIFRILGLSVTSANKLFLIIISILKLFTAYYAANYISKNERVARYVALIWVCAPFCSIFKIYICFAYAELIASVFMPLIILGLYNLVYEDFDKPHLIAIGMLGTVLSHLISAILMAILVLFFMILNYKSCILNFKKILKLFIAAFAVLLLTAFFWIPVVEQIIFEKFYFNKPWHNFIELCKPLNMTAEFLSQYISFSVAWILIFFFLAAVVLGFIFLIRKILKIQADEKNKKFLFDAAIICAVLVFMITDFFPWHLLKDVFGFLQMSCRLFCLVELLLSFCLPMVMVYYSKRYDANIKKRLKVLSSVIFSIAFLELVFLYSMPKQINEEILKQDVRIEEENFRWYNGDWIYTDDIGLGKEYLPLGTDITKCKDTHFGISDKKEFIPIRKCASSLSLDLKKDLEYEFFEVPRIYYLGYEAYGENLCGQKVKLEITKGENNSMVIKCKDEKYKKIEIKYSGTLLRHVAEFVSLISLLILVVICLLRVFL